MAIGFLSELWLSQKNPLHQRELDRRLHLEGYEFITNSRAARRGGGVGIVVNLNLGYTAKRLQVNCRVGASSLEVVWALVSPPSPVGGVKSFICASIYSPPKTRLNDSLIEHIQFNLNSLSAQYPGAGVFIAGDINNLDCTRLCNTFPDLLNVVASPTRGNKILDFVVTNLHEWYDKAVILPPIQPDVAGRGAASDHSVPIVRPNKDSANRTGFSRTEARTRRVVLASSLALLGMFLATFDWQAMHSLPGVDAKLDHVNSVLFSAQEYYCPVESFKVKVNRNYIVSAKLANLSRQKSNEFKKHRYSPKFKQLKKECRLEMKNIKKREKLSRL